MYNFSNWSVSQKKNALKIMDEYLKRNVKNTIYWTHWEKYGCHPDNIKRIEEISNDDEQFINALFWFYICLTTDLSWFHQS